MQDLAAAGGKDGQPRIHRMGAAAQGPQDPVGVPFIPGLADDLPIQPYDGVRPHHAGLWMAGKDRLRLAQGQGFHIGARVGEGDVLIGGADHGRKGQADQFKQLSPPGRLGSKDEFHDTDTSYACRLRVPRFFCY